MFKIFTVSICLLFITGCETKQYTFHQEYVEESVWDKDKGIVKEFKTSFQVNWKD